jgi:hypothetical protein
MVNVGPPLPPRPEAPPSGTDWRRARPRHQLLRRRVRGIIAGIAAIAFGAAVAVSLAVGRSPTPSAQCKAQVARIAVLENDAAAISSSSAVVSADAVTRFDADVFTSSVLLAQAKKEGCPVTGYPSGYTLK